MIKTIKSVDQIIISGGGNINSIWAGHLYFRFLVCFLSKKHCKPFFVSGQTIGPIKTKIDKILSCFIVKYSKILAIRDRNYSLNFINPIYWKYIFYTYDDAFNRISTETFKFIDNKNDTFYIGLSLHFCENGDDYVLKIQDYIKEIVKIKKNFTFVLIPHVFDEKDNGDLPYMEGIISSITSNYLKIKYLSIKKYSEKFNLSFELVIENITNNMDMVVTSRYHGAVFAIKNKVPCLMLGRNDYEIGKCIGLVQSINIKNDIIIDIRKPFSNKRIKVFFENISLIKKDFLFCMNNLDYNKLFINRYITYVKNSISRKKKSA